MKKLFIVSAFMLGFVGFTAVQANSVINHAVVCIQDGFVAIAADDLPDAVKKAMAKDFPDATLAESYVNENKQYKLVLNIGEASKTVYINENGEWIGNE